MRINSQHTVMVQKGIRKEGIQIVGYIDDCIVEMPQTTLEEVQQQLKTAINHFTQILFKKNPQKQHQYQHMLSPSWAWS